MKTVKKVRQTFAEITEETFWSERLLSSGEDIFKWAFRMRFSGSILDNNIKVKTQEAFK